MAIAERVPDRLHPSVAALAADPSGEAAFWARMAVQKTPLVEADPERPGWSLVTYVSQMPEGAESVVVLPGFGGPAQGRMERIEGTRTCHAAFRYRNDVRATYSFMVDVPAIDMDTVSQAEWTAFQAAMREKAPVPDPHARETFTHRAGEGMPDAVLSILSLPDARDASTALLRPDIPHGKVDRERLASAVLENERRIWVYTPPGYDPAAGPYPLLVAFDGGSSLTILPIQRILDNLADEGRVRPMVAVFVDNATADSRNVELPCSEPFARFIETELMPWVRERYAVTTDPTETYVTGVSYGGLATMWMGYRLPHIFGVLLAQSPSLWWGPTFDMAKAPSAQSPSYDWLTAQYEASPKLPLRIWHEIGLMEGDERMVEPSRRMKAVLEAKGYELTYSEFSGGHDYAWWRVTMPDALAAMAPPVAS